MSLITLHRQQRQKRSRSEPDWLTEVVDIPLLVFTALAVSVLVWIATS